MSREIPLSVQIGEVEREIKVREGVYFNQVRAGRMRQGDADKRLGIMREVLGTLQGLRAAASPPSAQHGGLVSSETQSGKPF